MEVSAGAPAASADTSRASLCARLSMRQTVSIIRETTITRVISKYIHIMYNLTWSNSDYAELPCERSRFRFLVTDKYLYGIHFFLSRV